MAVYLYPAEYYAFWREQYPEMELPWGMFGENLTIWGLRDDRVYIGDQLQVGSAQLVVTQPRMPCYKLALKFGHDDVLKRLLQSGYSGFYCAVLQEGGVAAGDPIRLLHRDEHAVSVLDIVRLHGEQKHDVNLLRRAIEVEALPQDWRDYFLDVSLISQLLSHRLLHQEGGHEQRTTVPFWNPGGNRPRRHPIARSLDYPGTQGRRSGLFNVYGS